MTKKGRITGIGGVFFKCENTDETKLWYKDHLNLESDQYGHMFVQRADDNPDKRTTLQWSPMGKETKYFMPSDSDFMINYRVENLKELLEELKAKGVQIIGEPETFEYGTFAWVMDPDGRKIELWEPIDEPFL